MLRHGDADILLMLEKTVPPVSLAPISIFASALSKFNNEARTQQKMKLILNKEHSLRTPTYGILKTIT
jgi:hypothetical protein